MGAHRQRHDIVVQLFGQPHAQIEPVLDDVDERVVHSNVQDDIRVSTSEAPEQRFQEYASRQPRQVEAKRPSR